MSKRERDFTATLEPQLKQHVRGDNKGDMKQVWIECANVQVVLRCFAAFALFLTIKSMMCDTSAWNAKGHKPE
ncbi:MAG: hypothetical protein FRX49_12842 [Trebouxia sp. A1-2]|nr:MAG: hypothetical protein FRX49_12842 [Trebouxia sp. A1-2]